MSTEIIYQGFTCELQIRRYANPKNVRIDLISAQEGPIATATVNLPVLLDEGLVALKDYSENFGIVALLEAAGVVARTGETIAVGYAEAHICRLLLE